MKSVKSESPSFPLELDTESSETTVFVRENITAVQRTGMDGTTTTMYTYDEKQYSRAEYSELVAAQNRADIDYLSIMTGVEL